MTSDRRVLLRAEVRARASETVSHTQALSERRVLVRCDEPLPVGQPVQLEMSLRGHVGPIVAEGTVVGHEGSGRSGDPIALVVELSLENDLQRRQIASLLDRLDGTRPAQARDYRVLLVDDSQLVRDLFTYGVTKYFRRERGHVRIQPAGDGLTAWGLLREQTFDLAIVDYYLPVLDGAKLIARIRAEPALRDLLVVALSVGGAEARQTMLAAGADLFLAKPVVLRDLFATLECLTLGEAS